MELRTLVIFVHKDGQVVLHNQEAETLADTQIGLLNKPDRIDEFMFEVRRAVEGAWDELNGRR